MIKPTIILSCRNKFISSVKNGTRARCQSPPPPKRTKDVEHRPSPGLLEGPRLLHSDSSPFRPWVKPMSEPLIKSSQKSSDEMDEADIEYDV